MSEEVNEAVEQKSFLNEMLSRTTKQIRDDRGRDIAEDLQMSYKRKVEDLENDINRLSRKQNNAFDFSPNSTTSLVVKDVDGKTIMEEDLATSVKLRQMRIELDIAKSRFNFLFGHTYELEGIV